MQKKRAIIPLDMNDRDNHSENPENIEIVVYRGNNSFELYEDDGETKEFENGKFAITRFEVAEKNDIVTFTVNPAAGDISVVPEMRCYTFNFKDIVGADTLEVYVNGELTAPSMAEDDNIKLSLIGVKPADDVKIIIKGVKALTNNHKEEIINLVTKYQLEVNHKLKTYSKCVEDNNYIPNVKKQFKKPLEEIKKMK